MSAESLIFPALKGLVGNRCYPATFEQPGGLPIWPAIRYTVISADNAADICGTDYTDTDDTRVQIDIVAKNYYDVIILRDQVIGALMGLTPPATRIGGGFQTYDDGTKTYRVVLDYLFSASSGYSGSPP